MAKKATITRAEYLQLVGLKTIGVKHQKMVVEIEEAMCSVLGVNRDDNMSAVGDVIWEDLDIEWLMKYIGVTLEEEGI